MTKPNPDQEKLTRAFTTALSLGMQTHDTEMVASALEAGADPDDALTRAMDSRNLTWVKMAVEAGADINAKRSRYSARVEAMVEAPVTFLLQYHPETDILEYFISQGFDVNSVNDRGESLLHCLAGSKHTEMIDCLLDHGADPMQKTQDGTFALSVVESNSNIDLSERARLTKRMLGIYLAHQGIQAPEGHGQAADDVATTKDISAPAPPAFKKKTGGSGFNL